MNDGAHELIEKNSLFQDGGNVYKCEYHGIFVTINTNQKYCTCYKFLDKGMCKHLIAAFIMDNIELIGLKKKNHKFQSVRNRFRKKNMDSSTENEDENNKELEVDDSVVKKPKRGRPPKVPKALELDHNKKNKSKKGTERKSDRTDNAKKSLCSKESKRRRGRPPKKKLSEVESNTVTGSKKSKGKRGRPPKLIKM